MNISMEVIDRWIEEHKEEMIEELKLWASQPSVSRADLAAPNAPYGPDCRKMLDLALSECKRLGFRTEDYEGYCGAVLFGDSEKEIGLVAHLDVVPEGDHWIYEPYKPVMENGFLIGRGVSDNKGPAIVSLYTMKLFKELGVKLNHTIRLMLGCAEETGMADFVHYNEVLHGPVPEFGIVCDASFPVCYAQKGGFDARFEIPAGKNIVDFKAGLVRNSIPDAAFLTISGADLEAVKDVLKDFPKVEAEADGANVLLTAHGKAGHAAFPAHDVMNNAVVLMADAAVALEEKCGLDLKGVSFISKRFATAFGHGFGIDYKDEESGELTLNLGIIKKVEDQLILTIDIRYPVSDHAERIEKLLQEAALEEGGKLIIEGIAKPYYISPEDPKVKALMEVYRSITGDMTEPYSMGGGTYSRVVPNAISFGPGLRNGHQPDFMPEGHGGAHGPDETLNIEDWLTGFKIYILSILKLDEILK